MSNRIFKALTKQAIEQFQMAFSSDKEFFWDEEAKKLIHPGEFGTYRENSVKQLLRLFLPDQLEIGAGFIITNRDDVSTQCDIIIYDKLSNAVVESNLEQKFFPIECVVAVGEIKSDVGSIAALNSHLDKLSRIKMLREKGKNQEVKRRTSIKMVYDPELVPYDQIFTFLLCNKFDFNFSTDKIRYANNVQDRFKHNLILSAADGFITYMTPEDNGRIPFPVAGSKIMSNCFVPSDKDNSHILHFLREMTTVKHITVLETDMSLYVYDDDEMLNELDN